MLPAFPATGYHVAEMMTSTDPRLAEAEAAVERKGVDERRQKRTLPSRRNPQREEATMRGTEDSQREEELLRGAAEHHRQRDEKTENTMSSLYRGKDTPLMASYLKPSFPIERSNKLDRDDDLSRRRRLHRIAMAAQTIEKSAGGTMPLHGNEEPEQQGWNETSKDARTLNHPSTTIKEDPSRPHSASSSSSIETESHDAVRVVVRVRPPLPRELSNARSYSNAVEIDASERMITISENLEAAASGGVRDGIVYNTYRFAFDRTYPPQTPQERIYKDAAKDAVGNVLVGYNASIIAFGQTGSGKTYTMTGDLQGAHRGIIPRAIEDVFTHIQRDTGERCKFLVRASYLQIYNEVISDLLKPSSTNLNVREDRTRGVRVEGLSEWIVRTPSDVFALMERGAAARVTGATKMNELSSRSHAIFQLIVEKSVLEDPEGFTTDGGLAAAAALAGAPSVRPLRQKVRVGKLNLVDLAGSERVHVTGAKGKRLEESKKINQSLSALGNVIAALTDPKGKEGRPHVPYRDSKLTRILEDSLGGNCKTTFMAMISPAVEALPESLSTLKFAHRTKRVRNAPRVNEDLDHRALLRKYERELRRLRTELKQRSKDLVDKRLVLQIEEARRREQADKIAAITALERQSAEIVRQKNAMAALQSRIASMQSQLLVGGQGLEHIPAFRTLLEKEHARMRKEYDARVAELEAQRRAVQQDRAAAVKIRELMIKQRDVIHALLDRVGQLDGRVLELQAAVEAAEARAKEAEDLLDAKTAELIGLRKRIVVEDRRTPNIIHAEKAPAASQAAAALAPRNVEDRPKSGDVRWHRRNHGVKESEADDAEDDLRSRSAPPIYLDGFSEGVLSGPQEVPESFAFVGGDTSSGSSTSQTDPDEEDARQLDTMEAGHPSTEEDRYDVRRDRLRSAGCDEDRENDRSVAQTVQLRKEKEALRSILQDKILAVVVEMRRHVAVEEEKEEECSEPGNVDMGSVDGLRSAAAPGTLTLTSPLKPKNNGDERRLEMSKLQKQMEYLQKLVSATVEALN